MGDDDDDNLSSSNSTNSFVVNLLTSLVIGFSAVLTFAYVRRTKPHIFVARRYLEPWHAPPEVPDGYFSWIPILIQVPEDYMMKIGLDAVVFLRFFKLNMKLFSFCSVYGLIVLLPINSSGDNEQEDMEYYSIANIKEGSDRLWAHLVSVWLFSFAAFVLLYNEYYAFVKIRHNYLRTHPLPHHFCIRVRDVPKAFQSEPQLADYFKALYPYDFHAAFILRDTHDLDHLVETRANIIQKLEHAIGEYKMTTVRPTLSFGLLSCFGEKVDAIKHWHTELEKINHRIDKELERCQALFALRAVNSSATGCVAFKTPAVAAIASQVVHSASPHHFKVEIAPDPRDVYWPNMIKIRKKDRFSRRIVGSFAIFCLICFWSIPATFVASLSTIERLSEELGFLDTFVSGGPVATGFVQGVLPALLLILFMSRLPKLIMLLAQHEGIDTHTAMQRAVLERFFYFQLINVFLIPTITGTVFGALDKLLDDPSSFLSLISEALPSMACFFTNYVIFQAFAGLYWEMVRPWPMIKSWFKRSFSATTEKERIAADHPGHPHYGDWLPKYILIVILGLTYSALFPIILPAALLLNAICHFVYKHNLVFLYVHDFDSGGLLWPLVFDRMCMGLLVYQIMMIGVFSFKLAYTQAPLLIPLPFITLTFRWTCHQAFKKMAYSLPLELAARMKVSPDQLNQINLASTYTQPSLKPLPQPDTDGLLVGTGGSGSRPNEPVILGRTELAV